MRTLGYQTGHELGIGGRGAFCAGRSHPKAISAVQMRLENMLQARNPTDPFAFKPEIGAELRKALRSQ